MDPNAECRTPNARIPSAARYFDNAATTPLDPRVFREMLPYLEDGFGNANSLHSFGQRARAGVELARARVANLIGAEDPAQIIFNSGATEGNNQVLRSFSTGAVSPFEHSAVREPAQRLGFEVLENDGLTILPPATRPHLVSVMSVNNEIGTIWDSKTLWRYGVFAHSDITQAVGKIPVNLFGLSFATFSAHKFYGPKGVGALYFIDAPPLPLMLGGEQESFIRGGTLNVPGIVGMGAAAVIAGDELEQSQTFSRELRSVLLDGLSGCTDWRINGGEKVSPHILSLSFLGVEGETLVIELDRSGFAISSGAACSSHSTQPSHVLLALRVDESWARGTVRISFGRYCTLEAAFGLANTLRQAVEKLRRML